jgi:hypothetical protein
MEDERAAALDGAACSGARYCQLQLLIYRCRYITVDSAITSLQNDACTHWCISKQKHYKTNFSRKGCMKSLEFYENYITLFFLEKTNFLKVIY